MQDSLKIEGIQPLIAPEPVEFWPPAPAWYFIGALVVLLVIYLIYRYFKYKSHNKYRQLAAGQLQEIIIQIKEENQRQKGLIALNRLLKSVALKRFERRKVASLTGEAWSSFLNASCKKVNFEKYPGNLVQKAGFVEKETLAKISEADIKQLESISKKWIMNHN